MKYLKTVDMWKNEEAVRNGTMKLQCGQWVDCGCNEQHPTKSRFVCVSGNVVVVAHGGNYKQVNSKFKTMVKYNK